MQLVYRGEVPTGDDGSPTVTVDTDGVFAAYAIPHTTEVEVVSLRSLSGPPLRIFSELQTRPVQTLCMGPGRLGTSDPTPSQNSSLQPGFLPPQNHPSHRQETHHHSSPQQHSLLFTASDDVVLAWDLFSAFAAAAEGAELPPPIPVMHNPGRVEAMALCSRTGLLAVCAGNDVHVFAIATFMHLFRLEGHTAPVLAVCFCEHAPNLMVTAGEDRTFKVWDLEGEGRLLYQSSILTAYPLTAVASDPSYARIAVGASDGMLRFFDLTSLPACRSLQAVDISKVLTRITEAQAVVVAELASGITGPRVISSRPSWKGKNANIYGAVDEPPSPSSPTDPTEPPDLAPTSACILALQYVMQAASSTDPSGRRPFDPWDEDTDGYDAPPLLPPTPHLLIATPRALSLVDCHTYEVLQAHFLGAETVALAVSAAAEGAAGKGGRVRSRYLAVQEASVAGCCAFAAAAPAGEGRTSMFCVSGAAILPSVEIFELLFPSGSGVSDQEEEHGVETRFGSKIWEVRANNKRAVVCACRDAGVDQQLKQQLIALGLPLAVLESKSSISVFQQQPLSKDSPLRVGSVVVPNPLGSPTKGIQQQRLPGQLPRSSSVGRSPTRPTSSSAHRASTGSGSSTIKPLLNLPVTFHKKVKSSGYGFVQPPVTMGRPPPAAIKLSRSSASSAVSRHVAAARQYPMACGPTVCPQPQHSLSQSAPLHHGAILRLMFSADSSRLLTCSADKTARATKLPMSKFRGEGTDFIIHNAAVHGIDCNSDGTQVLTASADRSARLWDMGYAQPLLDFTHANRHHHSNQPSGMAPAAAVPAPVKPANPAFLHEVRAARFFYMDQFIMLACGNKLNLYRHTLCDAKDNDIERLRNHNKFKLIAQHPSTSQAITTISVANTFLSPIAICAGSNRSIEIVDMSVNKCVSTLEEAHARPIHCIVQPTGGAFVSHPREVYELFATAATDGVAKLWDLRSGRCVRSFAGHKNSQLPCGISLSPCMRYLASGSEDKTAYLYDLRQATVLHRLRGMHGDAVMDVCYNPLYPQLATACLDGRVHFFSSEGESQ